MRQLVFVFLSSRMKESSEIWLLGELEVAIRRTRRVNASVSEFRCMGRGLAGNCAGNKKQLSLRGTMNE